METKTICRKFWVAYTGQAPIEKIVYARAEGQAIASFLVFDMPIETTDNKTRILSALQLITCCEVED